MRVRDIERLYGRICKPRLDEVCRLAAEGRADAEIAEHLGVDMRVFRHWCDKAFGRDADRDAYSGLASALTYHTVYPDRAAQESLFRNINGYYVDETKTVVRYNAEGEEKGSEVITTHKYIQPSMTALIYFLQNTDPERWNKPASLPEASTGRGGGVVLIPAVMQGQSPPCEATEVPQTITGPIIETECREVGKGD